LHSASATAAADQKARLKAEKAAERDRKRAEKNQ